MTLTQSVLILAFLVVGPLYGFIALRLSLRVRPARWRKPAKLSPCYDFFIVTAVAFAVFSAYAGWLLAGLQAMETYPQYPYESPGEAIALAYTIPGFITGILAVGLTYIAGRWFNPFLMVLMFILLFLLTLALCYFSFLGLLFPAQT